MSLFRRIRHKFLNKSSLDGNIYAVNHGIHKGKFLVYIDSIEEDHNFLILPEIDTQTIKKTDFEEGLKKTIVDLIERLPHNIYELCRAQYNESKTKSNNSRLKQSVTQSCMDRTKRKT
jgi:hypothetical protein